MADDEDDLVEEYAEGLRSREDHELVGELSRSYSRLKMLGTEEGSEDRENVIGDIAMLRRKIGALEEEIGRRKKNDAWAW
jgi:hypothetical protein